MSRLVLFDLDGTLLRTYGAGMRAMARAGVELFGDAFCFDGITTAGGLDPLLFATAAERCGITVTDEHHKSFAEIYVTTLSEELTLAAQSNGGLEIMPGVHEILDAMHTHEHVTLGMLTGNYTRTAPIKLTAGGIDPDRFVLGAYGDDAPDRPSLVPVALSRYQKHHNRPIDPEHVMLIGDTPKDIDAAKAHGAIAVGVATGPYSVEQLEEAGADLALENLSDASGMWTLLKL